MPYIQVTIAQKLDNSVKDRLQKELSDSISVIPGKTIANTIIAINDGVSMYNNHTPRDGAFFDVRLYKSSPEEAKKDYANKIFAIAQDVLNMPSTCVQINFTEMEIWASGGNFMN